MSPVIENLEINWPFAANFMEISLSVLELWHFKKRCQKQIFSASEKGAFFSLFDFFIKFHNFGGLWCPNHVTFRDSWVAMEIKYPYLSVGTYSFKTVPLVRSQ